MIHSMTAFARNDAQSEVGNFICEVRSVNHRFLEINIRLNEPLKALEPILREQLNKRLSRGKIECNIIYTANGHMQALQLNQDLVKQLLQAGQQISDFANDVAPINVLDILRWPGVIEQSEIDTEVIKNTILDLLNKSINDLIEHRAREGKALMNTLQQRISQMKSEIKLAKNRVPTIVDNIRQKIHTKMQELASAPEAHRIEQEVALLLQKTDVQEEIDRLLTHVEEVEHVINEGGVIGRRLDFLMQELHREANTLGSKSADTELTKHSVELKVLIDQMREQIQNIE